LGIIFLSAGVFVSAAAVLPAGDFLAPAAFPSAVLILSPAGVLSAIDSGVPSTILFRPGINSRVLSGIVPVIVSRVL